MSVGEYFTSAVGSARKFWEGLDVKHWLQDIAGSSSEMIDTSLCFGLSFGIGFFLKRYFRFLFFAALICLLAIKVMEYNNFITIHWETMQVALGIGDKFNLSVATGLAIEWIKVNFMLFVASLLGFFIGYKLG